MTRKRRSVLAVLALSAVLLAACAGQGAPTSGATAGPAGVDGMRAGFGLGQPAVGAPEPAPETVTTDEKAQGSTGTGTVPLPQVFDGERALILTASVALRASDPWGVSDRVQAIATGLGGDVMSLSQSGSGDDRTASLTIRVPQDRFNDALRQIRDVRDIEVLSSSVEGQDVTDQFIDLEARLKAKVAEEQRYLALLARAEAIEDILRIDQVLSQVRIQIEQLTAQLNSLKARTTFSTISVQVVPLLAQPPRDPGAYDPARTLEIATAALVSVLRVAMDAAIWALVFGWIPLTVLALAMLVSRVRDRTIPTT